MTSDPLVIQLQNRLRALETRLAAIEKQPRSEYTGGVERRATADLPPNMAGLIRFVTDMTRPNGSLGELAYNDNTAWIGVHDYAVYSLYALALLNYTVATLPNPPSITTGTTPVAFATNGRKSGEGAGAGTGVPVYWNVATSQWVKFSDNTVVTA